MPHYFAQHLPSLMWQPSDPDAEALASIAAHRAAADVSNLLPPLQLDVTAATWPVAHADAVVCCNMIHIAPWSACAGLIGGAARVLPAAGILYLYGPYKIDGRHTAPSNEAFDADLRGPIRHGGSATSATSRRWQNVMALPWRKPCPCRQ